MTTSGSMLGRGRDDAPRVSVERRLRRARPRRHARSLAGAFCVGDRLERDRRGGRRRTAERDPMIELGRADHADRRDHEAHHVAEPAIAHRSDRCVSSLRTVAAACARRDKNQIADTPPVTSVRNQRNWFAVIGSAVMRCLRTRVGDRIDQHPLGVVDEDRDHHRQEQPVEERDLEAARSRTRSDSRCTRRAAPSRTTCSSWCGPRA